MSFPLENQLLPSKDSFHPQQNSPLKYLFYWLQTNVLNLKEKNLQQPRHVLCNCQIKLQYVAAFLGSINIH